jgi:hypothetical protein
MKILDFFLFLWVIFALLDPDPQFECGSGSSNSINADPCGSGSGYGPETLANTGPYGSELNDLLDDQRARAVVNSEGTLGLLAASLLHNLVQFRIPVLQSQNLTHFLHKNYDITIR